MSTKAQEFFASDRVRELVASLKNELVSAQKKLNGVKPAPAESAAPYKTYIDKLQATRGRNLFYPYVGSGMGHGPYVELEDGSVKIDLINGIGIQLFGHSHPELVEASLKAALQDVIMQGNLQPNAEYGELLETLVNAAARTSRIRKGWICTCGTIANENALKIVRQKNSPARKIVAMKNNFAGRSTLMAEITDNAEYKVGLPKYDDVLYIPFFDKNDPQSTQKSADALKKHIADNPKNIACFMFEFVQGEGGFNVAPASFFKTLFEICRANQIAVWADEIQTFARTGELFCFETLGLGEYIDIVTIAKTVQCGAVLYTEEYNPKPGLIAGTFTAGTASLATGAKTLQMLLKGQPEKYLGEGGRIEAIHKEFTAMLGELQNGSCKGLIKEYGGLGLMVSMTPFDGSKDKVMKLLPVLFKNGVIAFSCGHDPYKIRFLLPLMLQKQHVAEVRSVLEKSLKEIAGA